MRARWKAFTTGETSLKDVQDGERVDFSKSSMKASACVFASTRVPLLAQTPVSGMPPSVPDPPDEAPLEELLALPLEEPLPLEETPPLLEELPLEELLPLDSPFPLEEPLPPEDPLPAPEEPVLPEEPPPPDDAPPPDDPLPVELPSAAGPDPSAPFISS
jgi:hypothetical protein